MGNGLHGISVASCGIGAGASGVVNNGAKGVFHGDLAQPLWINKVQNFSSIVIINYNKYANRDLALLSIAQVLNSAKGEILLPITQRLRAVRWKLRPSVVDTAEVRMYRADTAVMDDTCDGMKTFWWRGDSCKAKLFRAVAAMDMSKHPRTSVAAGHDSTVLCVGLTGGGNAQTVIGRTERHCCGACFDSRIFA